MKHCKIAIKNATFLTSNIFLMIRFKKEIIVFKRVMTIFKRLMIRIKKLRTKLVLTLKNNINKILT